jgi:hypothetical protein
VQAIERFVETKRLDLVKFEKGQRKDDVAQEYLAAFAGEEGVLFVGKAQEKAGVFRAEKRRNADDGSTYPRIDRSTTPVNHYYFYILDRDFGPLLIKVCSCFPYAIKVRLNGHEWLTRQLTQRGIAYEPLDNGIRSTEAAARVQRIASTLDAPKIDAVFRTWLRRLPHPFTAAHRVGDHRVLALMQALCLFALSPVGFRHRDVRTHLAQLFAAISISTRPVTPHTTCAVCGYTDSSNGSRAATAIGSPNSAPAWRCSRCASTPRLPPRRVAATRRYTPRLPSLRAPRRRARQTPRRGTPCCLTHLTQVLTSPSPL